MTTSKEESNIAIVREAFKTLFNKRDFAAAERFWSPNYIQHSALIPPGREGLFNLVKNAPSESRHESGVIAANGDFVMLHGRFSGGARISPLSECSSSASISAPTSTLNALSQNQSSNTTGAAREP